MKKMSSNAPSSDASCVAMRQFQENLQFDAQERAHQMPKERTEAEEIAQIRYFFELDRSR
jgi:hypothetical protein